MVKQPEIGGNVVPLKPPTLKCQGVGRIADNPRALSAAFNREPTDDELRFFHDCLRRWACLAGD